MLLFTGGQIGGSPRKRAAVCWKGSRASPSYAVAVAVRWLLPGYRPAGGRQQGISSNAPPHLRSYAEPAGLAAWLHRILNALFQSEIFRDLITSIKLGSGSASRIAGTRLGARRAAHRVKSADRASGGAALRRFTRSARSWRLRTATAEPGLERRSPGMLATRQVDPPRGVLPTEPIDSTMHPVESGSTGVHPHWQSRGPESPDPLIVSVSPRAKTCIRLRRDTADISAHTKCLQLCEQPRHRAVESPMATCLPCRPVRSLDTSQLTRCPPPSPLHAETCSRRGCHARRPRWGASQPRQRSRCEAAVDAASADAPAISPVPVITTAEPDTDASAQPYTTHSWQWRGHKINYAVRLCAFRSRAIVPDGVMFPPPSSCAGLLPWRSWPWHTLWHTIRPVTGSMHVYAWCYAAVRVQTAGCGKPVLLIHGFGASLGHFRKNIPALCAAGYKARRQS